MVDPPLITIMPHFSPRRALGACSLLILACCSVGPPQEGPLLGIGRDLDATFLDTGNVLILGGALASGMLLDSSTLSNQEDRIAHYFDSHDVIPDGVGRQLDTLGSGLFLMSAAGAWYGGSQLWGDAHDQEASMSMLSALTITGVTTLGSKSLFNDGRPNGSSGGYPSGHSSMAMAAASSLGESYGWKVGLPAYIGAVLVAVQRLDSRRHDLDDVIGGLALGYVVGTSVTARRMPRLIGADVVPILNPVAGDYGVALEWNF